MKRAENRFQTDKVLALLLFVLLAVCIVIVLLTGAGVFGRLTTRGQKTFENRTVPLYVATKVRQADCAGAVRVEKENGTDVLRLEEQIDGKGYVTRIYCYEGYVRELFAAGETVFDPAAGEKIAEASDICFLLEGGCLDIQVTQEDRTVIKQTLTLRSTVGEVVYEK